MKQRALLILSFFLVLVLLVASPISAKEIKVVSQFPMSGTLGALPELGWGYIDAMKWFNDEQGGVGGKKITYFLEDMRYKPSVEVANYTRISAQNSKDELIMASGYITDALKALIDKVNKEDKIPWIDGSYSSEIFGPEGGPSKYPYYYSMGAHYNDQHRVLVKWIKDNHKGPGKARVAFVYSPTAYGKDGPPAGIAYAKKLGLDVVAEIEYPFSATAATNECMTLRKAKTQYVIYHGFTGSQGCTAIFFKTIKKVIPKVQILGTHYIGGRFPILLIGKAFDGYIGAYCTPFLDAVPRSATIMENDWVKLCHDFAKKYRPEEYKKGLKGGGIRDIQMYEIGLRYAFIMQETLKIAHKAGDLTRPGVKKALDNLVWDFKGMFGGKTFAYKSHTIPMLKLYKTTVKMVKMGGKLVPTGNVTPLTDWIDTTKVTW